jgi:hypothetical protein
MQGKPINSAADLRAELAEVIRRYVAHLDWQAPTELVTVRIEATGPGLSVTYAEHAEEPPRLMVSIGSWTPEQAQDAGRGGRRGR